MGVPYIGVALYRGSLYIQYRRTFYMGVLYVGCDPSLQNIQGIYQKLKAMFVLFSEAIS